MKKETFIIICGGLFLVLLVIAIFNHPAVQTASAEMLHEIKTADVWQGAAYTAPMNQQQVALAQQAVMDQQGQLAQQAAMTSTGNGTAGGFPLS